MLAAITKGSRKGDKWYITSKSYNNFTIKLRAAVTEEKEKWKGLYETERDLVSSLQKQLNVEMEQ